MKTDASLAERLENLTAAKRALLEKKLGKGVSESNPFRIARRRERHTAPLSFNQEGILFVEQLEPNTSKYNVYEAIKCVGRLDGMILQRTLDQIVARHETLRTTFQNIDGNWQQVINTTTVASLEKIDISDDPNADPVTILQAEAD